MRWLALSLALAIATYALLEQKPVTLTCWPGYAQMAPATFVFVMIAPRHTGNRSACIAYEGPESRSFCWTLNGAEERKSWRVEWVIRHTGEYQATATINRMVDGELKTFTDSRPLRVLGME